MAMGKKHNHWTEPLGLTSRDAMRLARELLERMAEDYHGLALLNICRDVISLGYVAFCRTRNTVSFHEAVEVSLNERKDRRRQRTLYEIRSICRRVMASVPSFAAMRLRDITPTECGHALMTAFRTNLQYAKGRAVLHSVFSCGLRRGWCSSNPVDAIPKPLLREKEIEPLGWNDLTALLRTAKQEKYRCCMAPLGIMLWAGVRPTEVTRLSWEDIDWQERVICLRARHTKTGGSRHVTLYPALLAWLRRVPHVRCLTGKICPPNWVRRWRELRNEAGIVHWQQDVLRHTFASYHLKRWHDLPRLQEEMGHHSLTLLRTRYLSMKGITRQRAKLFWRVGGIYDMRD